MTDKLLIKQIRDIRFMNNTHWMRLLEIALDHAPAETKRVLTAINDNDREISVLIARLSQ